MLLYVCFYVSPLCDYRNNRSTHNIIITVYSDHQWYILTFKTPENSYIKTEVGNFYKNVCLVIFAKTVSMSWE